MAKQKAAAKKPTKPKAERPTSKASKPALKQAVEGRRSDSKSAAATKKRSASSSKQATSKAVTRKTSATKPTATKASTKKQAIKRVVKSASAAKTSKAVVAKTATSKTTGRKIVANKAVSTKTVTTKKVTKPAKPISPPQETAPARAAVAKVQPSTPAASRGTPTADKARLLTKPAPPRTAGNGQVAGVLQAARSVASRANKIVEVEKERKSHLSAEELAEFRQILLDKRRELVDDMVNLEDEARRTHSDGGSSSSAMPIHMADLGTDTWEQEFTLNLIEKERAIVREIDEALDRIEKKTYGTCLATGKSISKARLRVKPWAKYCIEYARKRELGLV